MGFFHVYFNVAIFHKVLREQAILNIQHLSMSVLREQPAFFSILVVSPFTLWPQSILNIISSIKFIQISVAQLHKQVKHPIETENTSSCIRNRVDIAFIIHVNLQ